MTAINIARGCGQHRSDWPGPPEQDTRGNEQSKPLPRSPSVRKPYTIPGPEAADWTKTEAEIAETGMAAAANEEQEKDTEMTISGAAPPMTS
jgi:hypothetical protein